MIDFERISLPDEKVTSHVDAAMSLRAPLIPILTPAPSLTPDPAPILSSSPILNPASVLKPNPILISAQTPPALPSDVIHQHAARCQIPPSFISTAEMMQSNDPHIDPGIADFFKASMETMEINNTTPFFQDIFGNVFYDREETRCTCKGAHLEYPMRPRYQPETEAISEETDSEIDMRLTRADRQDYPCATLIPYSMVADDIGYDDIEFDSKPERQSSYYQDKEIKLWNKVSFAFSDAQLNTNKNCFNSNGRRDSLRCHPSIQESYSTPFDTPPYTTFDNKESPLCPDTTNCQHAYSSIYLNSNTFSRNCEPSLECSIDSNFSNLLSFEEGSPDSQSCFLDSPLFEEAASKLNQSIKQASDDQHTITVQAPKYSTLLSKEIASASSTCSYNDYFSSNNQEPDKYIREYDVCEVEALKVFTEPVQKSYKTVSSPENSNDDEIRINKERINNTNPLDLKVEFKYEKELSFLKSLSLGPTQAPIGNREVSSLRNICSQDSEREHLINQGREIKQEIMTNHSQPMNKNHPHMFQDFHALVDIFSKLRQKKYNGMKNSSFVFPSNSIGYSKKNSHCKVKRANSHHSACAARAPQTVDALLSEKLPVYLNNLSKVKGKTNDIYIERDDSYKEFDQSTYPFCQKKAYTYYKSSRQNPKNGRLPSGQRIISKNYARQDKVQTRRQTRRTPAKKTIARKVTDTNIKRKSKIAYEDRSLDHQQFPIQKQKIPVSGQTQSRRKADAKRGDMPFESFNHTPFSTDVPDIFKPVVNLSKNNVCRKAGDSKMERFMNRSRRTSVNSLGSALTEDLVNIIEDLKNPCVHTNSTPESLSDPIGLQKNNTKFCSCCNNFTRSGTGRLPGGGALTASASCSPGGPPGRGAGPEQQTH